ncbi:hypothetical protein ACUOHO_26950, partial [Escherichia coli]
MQLTTSANHTAIGVTDLSIFPSKDVAAWQAALHTQLQSITPAVIFISHVASQSIRVQLQTFLQQLAPTITPQWLQAET